MELQVCDILLKRGANPFAWAIRELTAEGEPMEKSYSHCGIYNGEVDGVPMIYDCRFPTVNLRELDFHDYSVYRINLTDDEKQKLIESCKSKIGEHYAVVQLFAEGLEMIAHIPVDISFENEDWCSTFVNHRFGEIGHLITRKERCTPNDISWSVVGDLIHR